MKLYFAKILGYQEFPEVGSGVQFEFEISQTMSPM